MSGPTGPQPRGGRVGIVEGWELRQARQREANSGAWRGLIFVLIAILVLGVGGWFAARPVLGPAVTGLFQDNPGIIRIPILGDLLRAELSDRIGASAADDDTEIRFVIEPGQTIDEIQQNLVDAGLIRDTVAFKYLVVSDHVDELIQAGTYTMTPRMSPTDVVGRLAADPDPPTPVINLALRPGLRIEQIVAYLEQQTQEAGLELDPAEFRELAAHPPRASATRTRSCARCRPATASRASCQEASIPSRSPSPPTSSCSCCSRHGRRRTESSWLRPAARAWTSTMP